MSFTLSRTIPAYFWLAAAGVLLLLAPKISVSLPTTDEDYSYTIVHDHISSTLDWEEKIATFSVKPRPKPAPVAVKPVVVVNYPAPTDLEAIFSEAAKIYNVDKDLLTKIAKCESNFHSDSINPGGPYLGMFQYLESTWISTRKAMGADPNPSLVFNAEEAIKTSAWKIAHGGLDAWPVCGK
ncbi:transglycosylase family protein [Patescibacteria group bacterium]|nr:transglycosylase family protein [Patescibacteria group bacterium]